MEERGKRSPIFIAILFLIVVAALLAYMTSRAQTVTPVPEEGLRVIFVSPAPTETPAPTASPTLSPRPTVTPRPRATATPRSEGNSASPTAKPTGVVTPSPKPTLTVTPKP